MFTCDVLNEVDFKCLVFYISGLFYRLKTLTFLVMSLKLNLIDPFLQLIIALAIARNGRPKITGVCGLGLDTSCVLRLIKSMG